MSSALPAGRPVRPWLWLPAGAAVVLAGLLGLVLQASGGALALDHLLALEADSGFARRLTLAITELGAGPVLYPLLVLLAVRRRVRRRVSWALAWLPVLALAVGQVLEGVLFVTLPRSSPAAEGSSELLTSSFSSGHAAAATLGWGLLVNGLVRPRQRDEAPGGPFPHRRAVAVAVAMGLLVGASRVALAVHWPTDVLAAVALGVLLLYAATICDTRLTSRSASHTPGTAPAATSGRRWSSGRYWCVPAAVALLPVVLLLATPAPDRLKDLLVYQGAGGVAGAGQDVYGFRSAFNMPFTYPPFAALLSEPLSRMPIGVGQVLWTTASIAALVPLARIALAPVVHRLGLPLTVAALLLSSPVRSHLRFGQVGIFLVLAVAADLLRPSSGRARGLGLGLATAVKLTPAVFLPWLALARSWARLRATVLWLTAASAIGLALLWRSSVDYLSTASRDTTRFGANDIPGNQSVRGMLLRSELPDHLVQPTWLALSLVLVAVGTIGAVRLEHHRQRLAAVGVLAALSVAVSPISWVHHLVWLTLPLAALVAAGRWRLATGWYVLLLPGLPALGSQLATPLLGNLLTDLQGLTAVAAVLLLPVLCATRPGAGEATASQAGARKKAHQGKADRDEQRGDQAAGGALAQPVDGRAPRTG